MKTRIAELDGAAREWDRAVWLEKRRWFQRRYRRRKGELIKNMAAHLMKTLIEHGVTAVYIGYPRSINQDKANERNSSWPCWKVMIEIARCAENFGIAVYAIEESDTSKYCAYHGCEVERRPRGLVHYPHGHTLHSDINAALNILEKVGGKLPVRLKVLSFTPTPSEVLPAKKRNREKPIAPRFKAG